MKAGKVAILSGGTGNPFFTTDTGASLRGVEVEADVMLKGTVSIHLATTELFNLAIQRNTAHQRLLAV